VGEVGNAWIIVSRCRLKKRLRRNLIVCAAAVHAVPCYWGKDERAKTGIAQSKPGPQPRQSLVAEASADGNAFAALGAAAVEYGGSAFGLHAGPKAVGRDPLAAVGLKCALRHGIAPESLKWINCLKSVP